MLRRSALMLTVLACLVAFVVAGCGSKSSSSASAPASSGGSAAVSSTAAGTTHFAKTKFVIHVGLAFGAFHHWIYKPFKAGVFGKPLSHKFATLKAALAGLFIYHELKLAATDVKSSKILSTLFSPITLVAGKISALISQLKGGHYNPADINGIQGDITSLSSQAQAKGQPVTDIVQHIPGVG